MPAKQPSMTNCAKSAYVWNSSKCSPLHLSGCPAELPDFFSLHFPPCFCGLGICDPQSRAVHFDLSICLQNWVTRLDSAVHQNAFAPPHSIPSPAKEIAGGILWGEERN